MDLRDFLILGEQKCGGRTELAHALAQQPNAITDAKRGARGLPLAACYKLADLIGAQRDAVAAASALVTEKDEGVRAYLRPFAQATRIAQHVAVAGLAVSATVTLALENSASTIRTFLL